MKHKRKEREMHGLSIDPRTGRTTKLYTVWCAMRNRCKSTDAEGPNAAYTRNNIQVCQEWKDSYKAFHDWAYKNGYKEGLVIDREDTYGNYEPANCRFITQKENSQNQASGYNWHIHGEVYPSAPEAAKALGLSVGVITYRCKGRTRKEKNGKVYVTPPRDGYWVEPKYPQWESLYV